MARETFTKEQFWSELDALGEEDVRIRFSVTKQFGDVGPKHELAKLWLSDKREAREAASMAKIRRDVRVDRYIAIAAIIIAAIAAHAEIKWLISLVISWLS
ncbi:MAG: hypothetical protein KKA22_14855 [Gammaproteobacteria bacterium]|nr:hypothetical protein [Gammaproteobacteria bacterium]MBU1409416.1 hypothetical protein [Gammaproteobacteria bacterium]MBU1530598.1 hypothetical protein [Gammaproteobacteria bacterium]